MAKINILPAKVYNRIAAGEVVDRPYSVVKELVENAIDAGATEIEVYIEKGGKQLVRVVDNGCGIAREDLHSAFLPHATSKIFQAEDLENIVTLGFRGEAVASIASVSKMTILSRVENAPCYSLTSDGGELGQIVECTGEKGTDVRVEMLFFNAPVRLNFLKSDKNEETDITNYMSRFILNRSDIAFTYFVNGKKVLQSFGGGDEEAFASVYGAAILKECYRIDAEKHGIRIRGYIGNQNFFKANRSYQSIFLNGRYVVNATLSAALSNAYASYLMKRQYPFYVLHIDVPTEVVDVNVHPNKADVRFADNQSVYGCVYSVVSAVLDGQTKALEYVVPDSFTAAETPVNTQEEEKVKDEPKEDSFRFTFGYEEAKQAMETASPLFTAKKQGLELPFSDVEETPKRVEKGFFPNEEIGEYIPNALPVGRSRGKTKGNGAEELHKFFPDLYLEGSSLTMHDPQREEKKEKPQAKEEPTDFFAENKRYLEELDKKAKQNRIDVETCTYAGKLFNTYLLYERGEDVFIIDQHAAHERLIYNRLKEQMQNRSITQQPLLLPYTLTVNAFESGFLSEHLKEIRDIGFDIFESAPNTYQVTALPMDLQNIDLRKFFDEILSDVGGYRSIKLVDLLKDKLASAACKAAVKGGNDLTKGEIDGLFRLMDGDMGLKCPHGRPVVVKVTKTDLEKLFKRIV